MDGAHLTYLFIYLWTPGFFLPLAPVSSPAVITGVRAPCFVLYTQVELQDHSFILNFFEKNPYCFFLSFQVLFFNLFLKILFIFS